MLKPNYLSELLPYYNQVTKKRGVLQRGVATNFLLHWWEKKLTPKQ